MTGFAQANSNILFNTRAWSNKKSGKDKIPDLMAGKNWF
jgi:hypothetical protein